MSYFKVVLEIDAQSDTTEKDLTSTIISKLDGVETLDDHKMSVDMIEVSAFK